MKANFSSESAAIDQLDRQIIRALQISPRAPFSLLAELLGVSEQTVARRYRRLRAGGYMRIVAVMDPLAIGESNWTVRVRCQPDGASAIANALARRDDVGWVTISAGGSEVVCYVRSRTPELRDDLLLERLPRSSAVLGIEVAVVLHRFPDSLDWTAFGGTLTAEQTERLGTSRQARYVPGSTPLLLDGADEAIVDVLQRDGRASVATMAGAANISEPRTARRLSSLLESGTVYLDVDLAAGPLGFRAQAGLWISTPPGRVRAAGTALDQLPEVAFAAAITGRNNLYVAVVCVDTDHLYRFLVDRVGAIDGVEELEVSLVHRVVKQAGALTDGYRLTPPSPRRNPRGDNRVDEGQAPRPPRKSV